MQDNEDVHEEVAMDARMNALRASEVALLAGGWLVGSGVLIGLGPIVWSGGTMKLLVDFPHAPTLLANIVGGAIAVLMCAARAWGHQPPAVSWVACLMGLVAAIVPLVTNAPAYAQQHNLLAGLALAVAAAMSATLHKGTIGAPSKPDWVAPGPETEPAPAEETVSSAGS